MTGPARFAAICAVLLTGGTAFSFPEMIRHGYASCKACHVSPSGGGLLTDYGRSLEGVSSGPVLSGGDVRYLNANGRRFLMQVDMEVGKATEYVTAVIGGDAIHNEVNGYLAAHALGLSLRAGRFAPAFGLNIPDHTAVTRQLAGLGKGYRQLGVELSLVSDYGEVFVGGFEDYQALRASVFLVGHISFGGSYRSDGLYGAHILAGIDRFYYLGEFLREGAYGLIGFEATPEMHLRVIGQVSDVFQYGLEGQFLPARHWEFICRVTYATDWAYLALIHYYL